MDELEKLQQKKLEMENQLKRYQEEEKILKKKAADMTRNIRTHRLCSRGGMVEKFIREPELFTQDDVMDILTFAFNTDAVRQKVNQVIQNRKNAVKKAETVTVPSTEKKPEEGNSVKKD